MPVRHVFVQIVFSISRIVAQNAFFRPGFGAVVAQMAT